MTNFERIKAMTFEEMAKFINEKTTCMMCVCLDMEVLKCKQKYPCLEGNKKWLELEAEK